MPKKDVDSRLEGIRVHLTWPQKEKNITVIGTAIHAKNGIRVDGVKQVRQNARTKNDIEFAQSIVVNKITESVEDSQKKERMKLHGADALSYNCLMVKAFFDLFGAIIDSRRTDTAQIIHPWAESTQRACVIYFYRNVLPQIQDVEFEADFTAVEKEDILKKLTELARNRMKEKDDEEEARNIAIRHLNDSDRIYSEMRYHEPSLPEIDLRCDVKRRRKKTEQLKRLPLTIHKKFREVIEESMDDNPYMARAAVLMDSAGARSGEAAATWSGWHDDYGTFVVVKILAQEEKGMRIERLKSKDSYRVVVLDEWGTKMIRKCNEKIGAEEFTEQSPLLDINLSLWVRTKLREAGCTDDYIREAFTDMTQNPEYNANGKPIRDIAAHICRRNRASIWRNYCGYSQDELDYALGHRNSRKRFEKNDPTSLETFKKLARKNAHYDMFPDISDSPKHRPMEISGAGELEIPDFDVVRFINTSNEVIRIKIDALAKEAGERIEIITSMVGHSDLHDRSLPNDGIRRSMCVIGTLVDVNEKDLEGEYEEE